MVPAGVPALTAGVVNECVCAALRPLVVPDTETVCVCAPALDEA